MSANTPAAYNGFMLNTVLASYTATTFQVRAMFTETSPKAFGQVWFTYGAPAAPPTTSIVVPAPTTTAPPMSTWTTPATTADPTTAASPAGGGS
ncbi:hypothetical protein [Amycolatopsis australiensis]|uniref:Uncharacterized protein n=1 Tax=Amycolatopsis australiensis TaxID=546364 RepID=A0A1K1RW10_9PSEU|nr:hypothetical protein [Amycolatopsis australiensis]SFW76020.1 hypothetical protein SAMN04489730_4035 [Amycolatopsis australiensis]